MRRYGLFFFALSVACCASAPLSLFAADIVIPTVPVGDPGNLADLSPGGTITDDPRGAVSYHYRIGTTEVTNAQYAAFLNLKAKSDPLGLYTAQMDVTISRYGGITRTGTPGNYSYAPRANMADKPVSNIPWPSVLRFVNWLNNGQGDSDTETGAYTLIGNGPIPANLDTITRNPGAKWFLPNGDEWYKAAYYQPASKGGDFDGYWLYATGSNIAPTAALADAVGNVSNPGANVATYGFNSDWGGVNGAMTTVGTAGNTSYYGTYDQTGNVSEWVEDWAPEDPVFYGPRRGTFGGSSFSDANYLRSFFYNDAQSALYSPRIGFRVATVPEPSTFALAGIGGAAFLALVIRRRLSTRLLTTSSHCHTT